MLARDLVGELTVAGVRLSLEGGQIVLDGPPEVLTPERLEELRRHRAEILAALAAPDIAAFEERAAIAEHDGETPREEAEALAAREQGFASADDRHREAVARWAAEIDRLASLPAVSRDGAEALRRAQAFIAGEWAYQAARLGWSEVELFGACPRAPWARLDRKGAAFGGAVQAVTAEAVAYVGGLRRYRVMVNNDGGAVPIWELAAEGAA